MSNLKDIHVLMPLTVIDNYVSSWDLDPETETVRLIGPKSNIPEDCDLSHIDSSQRFTLDQFDDLDILQGICVARPGANPILANCYPNNDRISCEKENGCEWDVLDIAKCRPLFGENDLLEGCYLLELENNCTSAPKCEWAKGWNKIVIQKPSEWCAAGEDSCDTSTPWEYIELRKTLEFQPYALDGTTIVGGLQDCVTKPHYYGLGTTCLKGKAENTLNDINTHSMELKRILENQVEDFEQCVDPNLLSFTKIKKCIIKDRDTSWTADIATNLLKFVEIHNSQHSAAAPSTDRIDTALILFPNMVVSEIRKNTQLSGCQTTDVTCQTQDKIKLMNMNWQGSVFENFQIHNIRLFSSNMKDTRFGIVSNIEAYSTNFEGASFNEIRDSTFKNCIFERSNFLILDGINFIQSNLMFSNFNSINTNSVIINNCEICNMDIRLATSKYLGTT